MDILQHQKTEIKEWIDTITDENILEEILAIKTNTPFDFEKEWSRSISGDELRKRTTAHINSLDCQKQ